MQPCGRFTTKKGAEVAREQWEKVHRGELPAPPGWVRPDRLPAQNIRRRSHQHSGVPPRELAVTGSSSSPPSPPAQRRRGSPAVACAQGAPSACSPSCLPGRTSASSKAFSRGGRGGTPSVRVSSAVRPLATPSSAKAPPRAPCGSGSATARARGAVRLPAAPCSPASEGCAQAPPRGSRACDNTSYECCGGSSGCDTALPRYFFSRLRAASGTSATCGVAALRDGGGGTASSPASAHRCRRITSLCPLPRPSRGHRGCSGCVPYASSAPCAASCAAPSVSTRLRCVVFCLSSVIFLIVGKVGVGTRSRSSIYPPGLTSTGQPYGRISD